jgi:hypothetical protein
MKAKPTTIVVIKLAMFIVFFSVSFSCKKDISKEANSQSTISNASTSAEVPPFNLEAILTGENGGFGTVKFRQDNDTARIINLDTWVRDLLPNHAYMLQRAVDPIATGQCLSTAWLTLGLGLQPKAIITDDKGSGTAALWRDITAIPRGTQFNIHFQVIDSLSSVVVLTSDCYQYTVR